MTNMTLQHVIEQYLRTLTPWQVVKLALGIAVLIGVCIGLVIGLEFNQYRITNELNHTAWSELNYYRVGDKAYSITPVSVECISIPIALNYPRGVPCVITNLHNTSQRELRLVVK